MSPKKPAIRHFLDLDRVDARALQSIQSRARVFSNDRGAGRAQSLAGATLVCLFQKPSTRTRVSFQVAMQQMGGHVIVLSAQESQLGRGETIGDTARVLSRYADAIMLRTGDAGMLEALAEGASVPVINGLTPLSHPCQVVADLITIENRLGSLKDRIVSWLGDGNNVLNSWIHAAMRFPFQLRIAAPADYAPDPLLIERAIAEGARIALIADPAEAADGAHVVTTDTWVSMSDADADARKAALAPYQVTEAIMARTRKDGIFLHCLPAHRGEEVVDAVIDGPKSAVWDQAGNRVHAQKAILDWCINGTQM